MLASILSDKSTKPKEKIESISQLVLKKEIKAADIITFAESAKDPDKANCIEALEFASKADPKTVDKNTFDFVVKSLGEKAPRIKWESAKVIGNTAHLFPTKLDEAIVGLVKNSEDTGTVVRWAAAFALGEIVKLKGQHNKDLIPVIESIILREEKSSIKKIYQAALKKTH